MPLMLVACVETPPADYSTPLTRCPDGSRWSGDHCVWQSVVTEVHCPTGSTWNGTACVGNTTNCPPGTTFNGSSCARPDGPPRTSLIATAVGGRCIFELDGAPLGRPSSGFVREVAPGQHRVECNTRDRNRAKVVDVAAGTRGEVIFDLGSSRAPQGGRGKLVGIAIGGSCDWTVDGIDKGAGSSMQMEVPVGTYEVACGHPAITAPQRIIVTGDQPGVATFRIGQGAVSAPGSVPDPLSPGPGSTASGDPGGTIVAIATGGECDFTIDGQAQGRKASLRAHVEPGLHTVGCTNGGMTRTERVNVVKGKPAIVQFQVGRKVGSEIADPWNAR